MPEDTSENRLFQRKRANESVLKLQRAWQEEKRPVWLEQRDGGEIREVVGRGQRRSWGAPQVMVEKCGGCIKAYVGVQVT